MEELEAYREYLGRLPLSPHTRRNYLLRVRRYFQWIQDTPGVSGALSDPVERDFAVNDYKNFLLQRGVAANSINGVLAALDNLYLFLGLGPAKVKRQDLPVCAPRALEPEEQRRLLKVIAQCKSLRNRAIALVMLHCGLRISECAQLNAGDVLLSARKRELVVRCGKGSKRRVVPINTDLADVLLSYMATVKTNPDSPLFVSQLGNRLSVAAIDHLIRQLGRQAGVELSAHRLRHTCLTKLVRAGVDMVTVAEVAGHGRLETTRRYSLPSEDVKISAMEKLRYGST